MKKTPIEIEAEAAAYERYLDSILFPIDHDQYRNLFEPQTPAARLRLLRHQIKERQRDL